MYGKQMLKRSSMTGVMKSDFRSAFFDTAPLIYLIEGHPQFASLVQSILTYCQAHSVLLTTSALTGLKFKAKPMRNNRLDVVQVYDALITDFNITQVPVTTEVVENALHLQLKLLSLKAMDTMKLGAALTHGRAVSITNDKRLNQLNHPNIITLDQWK